MSSAPTTTREAPQDAPAASGGGQRRRMFMRLARNASVLSIATILILVVVIFSSLNDLFFSSANILDVIRQSSPALIVGVGSTFVLTAAGIDLSIGSVVSFAGTLAALLMSHSFSPTVAFVLVIAAGVAVGIANGFFIAVKGLPSFIVTLAALSIIAGGAQAMAKGFSIPVGDSWLVTLAQGRVAGIPNVALIAGLVAVVGWVVLERTAFGRHVQGVGSNEEAVRRSGVSTTRVIVAVYAISGFSAALAGVLIAGRLQSGGATNGTGLELQVIAAVVLGGTSIFGGRGTMIGTVLGVLTIAFINNGLVLEDVQPFYVTMIQGVILLVAVYANIRVFPRLIRRFDVPQNLASDAPASAPTREG